eukprot:UN03000
MLIDLTATISTGENYPNVPLIFGMIEFLQCLTHGLYPALFYQHSHGTTDYFDITISDTIQHLSNQQSKKIILLAQQQQNNNNIDTDLLLKKITLQHYRALQQLLQIPYFTPLLALLCIQKYNIIVYSRLFG